LLFLINNVIINIY